MVVVWERKKRVLDPPEGGDKEVHERTPEAPTGVQARAACDPLVKGSVALVVLSPMHTLPRIKSVSRADSSNVYAVKMLPLACRPEQCVGGDTY